MSVRTVSYISNTYFYTTSNVYRINLLSTLFISDVMYEWIFTRLMSLSRITNILSSVNRLVFGRLSKAIHRPLERPPSPRSSPSKAALGGWTEMVHSHGAMMTSCYETVTSVEDSGALTTPILTPGSRQSSVEVSRGVVGGSGAKMTQSVSLLSMKALLVLCLWYTFSFTSLFLNKYVLDALHADILLFSK